MFDDQPINSGVQTPNNLPIGEPDDMFAGTEKNEDNLNQNSPFSVPESNPAPLRSALDAGILRPKDNVFPEVKPVNNYERPVSEAPYVPNMDVREINTIKEPGTARGIMIAVVVVLIVAFLGAIGWWFYKNFVVYEDLPVDDQNVDIVIPEGLSNDEVDLVTEPAGYEQVVTDNQDSLSDIGKDIIDEEILFGEPIDKDADGLDDNRETDIGTDPNNWDSDNDSLSDGDEVIIWKTDPMNPDSDGDSYLDGAEVKSGYNPAGPGKIFEIPNE